MMNGPERSAPEANTVARAARPDEGWGWYLYGITCAEEQIAGGASAAPPADSGDEERTEVVAQGRVWAVVRRVPLAEYAPETLRAHADDPAWLENTTRHHNRVIEAVHRERAILPAKLGCVYASLDDLCAALQAQQDDLLARLASIDGCDEWGVRLYGDPASIRRRAAAEHAGVRDLRRELASASPGRSYFLRQKLTGELAAAVDQALDALIAHVYACLAQHAASGQITRRSDGSRFGQEEGETEIVRAAFLVRRERADTFLDELRALVTSQPNLSCEYSGPWPPYSFAARIEEKSP